MITVIQRVSSASVSVAGEELGRIGTGLVALVAVERGDGEAQARRLLERVLTYRVFPDEQGRMNRSLLDAGAGLLLVPQFTLAADTDKGTRPGFSKAAEPEAGRRLFQVLLGAARERLGAVPAGRFGADMKVALVNDGPVTFRLRVKPSIN